jgi:hypothetical protein
MIQPSWGSGAGIGLARQGQWHYRSMMKASPILWTSGLLLIVVAVAVWRFIPLPNRSTPEPDRRSAAGPDASGATLRRASEVAHPRKRVAMLGQIAGRGPMLISEESDSGVITNTYEVSPTKFIVRVVSPHPMDQRLGSSDYETAAKADFERHVATETNLLEIKAILEDFPTATASQRLYSGIREAYVARARMRQLRDERYRNSDRVSRLWDESADDPSLTDAQRKKLNDEGTKLSEEGTTMLLLDYRDTGERLKQRLSRLYGELPKAVYQRLMSIEIYEPAEPLPAP